MDTDSLIKIVWGIMIFVIFVASKFKRKGQPQPHDSMGEQNEDDAPPRPINLETLFREELMRRASNDANPTEELKSDKQRVATPKQATPKVEARQEPRLESKVKVESKSKIAREFNLRRAVIETEILTPKFKNN